METKFDIDAYLRVAESRFASFDDDDSFEGYNGFDNDSFYPKIEKKLSFKRKKILLICR
jgi:hypothetical protein